MFKLSTFCKCDCLIVDLDNIIPSSMRAAEHTLLVSNASLTVFRALNVFANICWNQQSSSRLFQAGLSIFCVNGQLYRAVDKMQQGCHLGECSKMWIWEGQHWHDALAESNMMKVQLDTRLSSPLCRLFVFKMANNEPHHVLLCNLTLQLDFTAWYFSIFLAMV